MRAFEIEKREVPLSKFVCAHCKKWKPLFTVGKQETCMCEECLNKMFEVKQ